jgi:hypothetical protein
MHKEYSQRKLALKWLTKIALVSLFCLSVAKVFSQEAYVSAHPRIVFEAFKSCYPEDIGEITWQDGDWTISVGDRVFYWAEGRILPKALREKWQDYTPYVTYNYPQEVPDPRDFSPRYIENVRKFSNSDRRAQTKERCLDFQEALYGPLTREAIQNRLERVQIMGWSVRIDRKAAAALQNVALRIAQEAKSDSSLALFIRSLKPIGGFNWREIQGTAVKSYHSWALALDVLPKKMGGLSTFWDWERVYNSNWMSLPLERRWHPHPKVVQAFESEGFVWGGKWDLWDTMHFEYRPELIWLQKFLNNSFF